MANRELASQIDTAWYWYYNGEEFIDDGNLGKFMSFGAGDIDESLQEIIREALALGFTSLVKHTNPETADINPLSKESSKGNTWTIIWYSSDNLQQLQRLALFLAEKGLIRKTKTGRLYNISFKYNEQTAAKMYGADFTGAIKLEQLLNLQTGEPLPLV